LPEAGIRLSANTDCNEQRAVVAGKIIAWMLTFFPCEGSEGKGDTFSECIFTVSSVTQSNSQQ
jgi:hypothetical protein